jgi:ABC-type branched-subunit amino acid transport system ATPase component
MLLGRNGAGKTTTLRTIMGCGPGVERRGALPAGRLVGRTNG